jgi:hypothetical protein
MMTSFDGWDDHRYFISELTKNKQVISSGLSSRHDGISNRDLPDSDVELFPSPGINCNGPIPE